MNAHIYLHADEATREWQSRVEAGLSRLNLTLSRVLTTQEKLMSAVDDVVANQGKIEDLVTGIGTDIESLENEATQMLTLLKQALDANNMNALADAAKRQQSVVTALTAMRQGVQAFVAANDPSQLSGGTATTGAGTVGTSTDPAPPAPPVEPDPVPVAPPPEPTTDTPPVDQPTP